MNILERLLDAAYPARVGSRPDGFAELRLIYTDLLRQSRRLAHSAGLATDPGLERSLRALADEDGQQAARLRDKLIEAGALPPPPLTERVLSAGASQWARLVDVLELHRETRNRLVEATAHWMRERPALGEFLEKMTVREEQHILRLRDLIAHADPQAID